MFKILKVRLLSLYDFIIGIKYISIGPILDTIVMVSIALPVLNFQRLCRR